MPLMMLSVKDTSKLMHTRLVAIYLITIDYQHPSQQREIYWQQLDTLVCFGSLCCHWHQ